MLPYNSGTNGRWHKKCIKCVQPQKNIEQGCRVYNMYNMCACALKTAFSMSSVKLYFHKFWFIFADLYSNIIRAKAFWGTLTQRTHIFCLICILLHWGGEGWSNICVLPLQLFGLVNKLVKLLVGQHTMMGVMASRCWQLTAATTAMIIKFLNAFLCRFLLLTTAATTISNNS